MRAALGTCGASWDAQMTGRRDMIAARLEETGFKRHGSGSVGRVYCLWLSCDALRWALKRGTCPVADLVSGLRLSHLASGVSGHDTVSITRLLERS